MMLRLVPATLLAGALAGTVFLQPSSAAGVALAGGASAKSALPTPSGGSRLTTSVNAMEAIQIDLGSVQRTPRMPYPKTPTADLHLPIDRSTGEIAMTGRIIVKMRDDLGARAPRRAPIDRLVSTNGHNLGEVDAILSQYGGTIQQWITNRDDTALRAIELRAEARSGKGQPDLASFFAVVVHPSKVLEASRALNNLDVVELVEIERPLVLDQNATCDPMNQTACNAPSPTCDGSGFACNPDPGCVMQPPQCASGCRDLDCCDLVNQLLPYCNDPDQPAGWDLVCAAFANLICLQTIYDSIGPLPPAERYDPCFTDGTGAPNPLFAGIAPAITGGCFEAHDSRGCNVPGCCFAVCQVDPTCCIIGWDAGCVGLAASPALVTACDSTPNPGPTPVFSGSLMTNPVSGPGEPPLLASNWQTYILSQPSAGDFSPPDPAFVFTTLGFRGGGYDLQGVRALQTQFANLYQDGIEPNLSGRTVRVGIIEFSAFVNHEEFTTGTGGVPLTQPKVIPEPGQTMILIEGGANAPEHGTACLGINVAGDNGFGVTGIAHEAQGYFFPTLSVEEGSRLPNAIVSAAETFTDGDVLNFSIGFGGQGPIITSAPIAALIATCTQLGITSVMSAGNDGIPIDSAPFETGAIVVGACWPGGSVVPIGCTQSGIFHYCRMNFSNFSNTDASEEGLGTVHVAAWGTAVATTGYGVIFRGANGTNPNDPETNHLRTYTNAFNGTSAAAPIITGLVACIQGFAKQIYGSPIAPEQVRGILMEEANAVGDQCWPLNPITLGPGPDDPECNDDIFKDIGRFPDALQCAFAVLNGQFVSGNPTEVKVLYGSAVGTVTSFRIRAADGNYLKVASQYASAGTTIDKLPYLAGGPTTDISAFLETTIAPTELTNVSLSVQALSTSPYVLMGGYLYNFQDSRWDFLGVTFIGPGGGGGNFAINALNAQKYYGPNGTLQGRVWTCGLGLVGPHQVWYDLIELRVNAPTLPAG